MKLPRSQQLLLLVIMTMAIAYVAFASPKPYDFVEYWGAGRLLLDGGNPYDADQLHPLQRSVSDTVDKAIMMWNPPWALPLIAPFAALPWRIAHAVWLLTQLAALLLSADLLWRTYGGSPHRRPVAWLLGIVFAPTCFLLFIGQISGLLLLGLAGFLYLWTRDRPAMAGCVAALTALKPHHLALFALLLALEATRNRRAARAVVAGALVLVIGSVIATLMNPDIWQQYRAALGRPSSATFESMEDFEHDTLGYWLRQRIPGTPFAAMFIPLGVAVVGTVNYWVRQRVSFDRVRVLPMIVLISMLVTPYGAWAFDMVLLLVPIIALAVQRDRPEFERVNLYLLAGWLIANLFTVLKMPAWNAWIAPAVALLYVCFRRTESEPT